MNGKGPIRAKEGIANLHKHENALNYGVIDIPAAPYMRSAIENGFMVLYSSPAHTGKYASSKVPSRPGLRLLWVQS